MPWSMPIALLSDRLNFDKVYNTPQVDLDIYADFGSPGIPSDVSVAFDGTTGDTITLGAWPVGSIIKITLQNGAQLRGRGGGGGIGGVSFFDTFIALDVTTPGLPGIRGFPALAMGPTNVILNLDADDGFIFGGGGGGGGGGGSASGGGAGGGGGGGQGHAATAGGAGGLGNPAGTAGTAGGAGGPGTGGLLFADGGDGASWGARGETGDPGTFVNGGALGLAGNAIELIQAGADIALANNAVDTVNTSPTLTINFPAPHGAAIGERVVLLPLIGVRLYPTFNGITLLSSYEIQTVPTASSITVTHPSNASATGSGGAFLTALLQQPTAELNFVGAKSEQTMLGEGRFLGPMGVQQT